MRKVAVNGHLLSVKRSNHFPATAALEKELHAPQLPGMEYKKRRTESSTNATWTTATQRSCFDGMMGTFDDAALIDGHCLFPTIEWSDDEQAEVSDEEHVPKLRAAPLSHHTAGPERQVSFNRLRASLVLDPLPYIQPKNW